MILQLNINLNKQREILMSEYVYVPYLEEIPEWKQCYYDHSTVNQMIQFIVSCQKVSKRINKKLGIEERIVASMKKIYHIEKQVDQNNYSNNIVLQSRLETLRILEQWMHLLIIYSRQQKQISYMFVQYKSFLIKDKFQEYEYLLKLFGGHAEEHRNVMLLIQNLYIQAYYLQKSIVFNICQQQLVFYRLVNEINDQSELGQYLQYNVKMKRMQKQHKNMLGKIALIYGMDQHKMRHDKFKDSKNKRGHGVSVNECLLIGLSTGALILFALLVVMNRVISGISIQNNQIFRNHFTIWRGAAYVCFYMWILGLTLLFYQTTQINYNLIFHFQDHYMPQSKKVFLHASIFTFVYIILFLVFAWEIRDTLQTKFYHYAGLFWILLILYLIIPINLNKTHRNFNFVILLIKVLLSPCTTVNFFSIWIAEQFVSLNQPFGDLYYTICFTAKQNFQWCTKTAPNFNTAYILTVYLFRILQTVKLVYQMKAVNPNLTFNILDLVPLGCIRAALGALTVISALFNRLKLFDSSFTVWLIIAIVATIISWFVDVKGDWGFFDYSHKRVLRQKILLNKAKPLYYFFIVLDLALRTGWVLSISPFVLNSTGMSNFLFVMLISFIEILRRGVWNIFRVQFQHCKNCTQFQVTMRDGNILKQLRYKAAKLEQAIQNSKNQYKYHFIQLNIQPFQKSIVNKDCLGEPKNSIQEFKQQKYLKKMRKQLQLQLLKKKMNQRKKLKKQIQKIKTKCQYNLKIIQKILELHPLELVQIKTRSMII